MTETLPYHTIKYDDKKRFISYWHQIDEIIGLGLGPILEIGVGNAFVASYLKQKGIDVTTMDIDERLMSDIVGSVLAMPFAEGAFEVVACFEVLEHLQFSDFPVALREIHRVSGNHAILSLPDASSAHRIEVWIPKVGVFRRLIELPQLRTPEHVFRGEHYWEIGKRNYPLSRISMEIEQCGFIIEKTFRVFEHPYHRFFKLKKACKPVRRRGAFKV